MSAVVQVTRDVVPESCERCAETGRTCAACVQRRRYAWSLVSERGETFEAAGRIMGLESYRVPELPAGGRRSGGGARSLVSKHNGVESWRRRRTTGAS